MRLTEGLVQHQHQFAVEGLGTRSFPVVECASVSTQGTIRRRKPIVIELPETLGDLSRPQLSKSFKVLLRRMW